MISSSSRIIRLFFPYKLASLGRYFKKVLRNERIEASFFDCLFGLPQNAQLFFLSDG